MNWRIATALAVILAVHPLAASAQPIPEPVKAMIAAAARSGNAAALQSVISLAKKTNPQSAAEIDALAQQIQAEAERRRRYRLERQGFFNGWTGQGEFGASNSTGNTRTTGLSLGLSMTRDGLSWKHSLNATVDYQRDKGVEDKDRYFAGWESDYNVTKRLYTLGLLSWEDDRFAGFTSRLSESLGLGYSLIKSPRMTLSLEGGPALRQTDYIVGDSEAKFAGRAAAHYLWTIMPNLIFAEDVSFYGQSQDSTVTSDTGLTVNLIGALSARLSYHVQYESNPADALENTDTTSRVTLVYSF
jgi:putative salt-induced outer membrane protein